MGLGGSFAEKNKKVLHMCPDSTIIKPKIHYFKKEKRHGIC